jgi:hypothetical protein
MDVLIRAGMRVPDDISVIGFDDSHLARLSHINLTTVAQDVAEMATLTVRRLVARLEDGPAEAGREGAASPSGDPGQHRARAAGYCRRLSDFLSLTSIATMRTSNTPAISQSMPHLSAFRPVAREMPGFT